MDTDTEWTDWTDDTGGWVDPGSGDDDSDDGGTWDPGTWDPGTGGTWDPGTWDPGTGGTWDPGTGGTFDPGIFDPDPSVPDQYRYVQIFGHAPHPSGRIASGTGPVRLSADVADAWQWEGDSGTTRFTFTVERNASDALQPLTVQWSVAPDSDWVDWNDYWSNPALIETGADGSDFVGGVLPAGTITIAAGQVSATFDIAVQGDTEWETEERFTVALAGSSARLDAMILDDDMSALFTGYGDNVLNGTPSSETIDGGTGRDWVFYTDVRSAYQIEKTPRGFTVTGARSGTDTLEDIEVIGFADTYFAIDAPARTQTPLFANLDTDFLFDPVYYLLANPDLSPDIGLDEAAQHYVTRGAAQGRSPNAWFDASYYEQRWADLASLAWDEASLFAHYNQYGIWEGRSAGPRFDHFDGERYLDDWKDVGAYVDANLENFLGSRTNGAIWHFITYGSDEQRTAYDTSGLPVDLGYVL